MIHSVRLFKVDRLNKLVHFFFADVLLFIGYLKPDEPMTHRRISVIDLEDEFDLLALLEIPV